MQRALYILALSALCAGVFQVSALDAEANDKTMTSQTGAMNLSIESVLKLIGGVNLKQSDIKTGESIKDLTEWKSQIYASQATQVETKPGPRTAPPSPLRKAI